MGKFLSSVLAGALLLGLGTAARAQQPEPRALIEKAIKAMGGLDKLNLKVAAYRKSKGTFHTDGFTFTGESFSETGNRRRITLRGTIKDVSATRTLVMVGDDKGWISYDGVTYDLDAAFLDRIRKSAYADRVCSLVTLVKDKGYTLTSLGESQVKGTACHGLKVQKEGKPDVSLWFDRETGLLAKSANRVMDPNLNREVLQEVYHLDYRVLDPAEVDVQILKGAKVAVDGPALLDFLRRQTPDEKEQVRLKDLVIKLGHKSFSVRQRATAALKAAGVKAAALLRDALRDADREVARRAEQCLEHINQEQTLAASVVRLVALRRPAGAAEVLLDYAPWAPDETVTREVKGALAAVAGAPDKQDPVLVKALKDRDAKRRAFAEAALGKDGGAYLKQGWRRLAIEGLRLSMRSSLYRDGQLFMDLETTETHYFNRLEDSLFTRP